MTKEASIWIWTFQSVNGTLEPIKYLTSLALNAKNSMSTCYSPGGFWLVRDTRYRQTTYPNTRDCSWCKGSSQRLKNLYILGRALWSPVALHCMIQGLISTTISCIWHTWQTVLIRWWSFMIQLSTSIGSALCVCVRVRISHLGLLAFNLAKAPGLMTT